MDSLLENSDRIAYFEGIESLAQDGSKRAETKVSSKTTLVSW